MRNKTTTQNSEALKLTKQLMIISFVIIYKQQYWKQKIINNLLKARSRLQKSEESGTWSQHMQRTGRLIRRLPQSKGILASSSSTLCHFPTIQILLQLQYSIAQSQNHAMNKNQRPQIMLQRQSRKEMSQKLLIFRKKIKNQSN